MYPTYTAPVSDTTANSANAGDAAHTAGKVSMTKAGRPARPPVENITPPRTIDYATVALLVIVIAAVARAALLLGNNSALTKFVTDQNAKKPQKTFDAASSVHQLRTGAVISAVIIAVALGLLAWAMRRTRSASASRWALIVVFVVTGPLPFYVIPTSGLPGGVSLAGSVLGIASIVALGLVFVPKTSTTYFKACKLANIPEELRGQPRPGLASLFGQRRQATRPAQTRPTAQRPARTESASTRPDTAKAKAKVRSDADAVAKGAELARSRAKASKSRRTVG
jgi:hypothetical protein